MKISILYVSKEQELNAKPTLQWIQILVTPLIIIPTPHLRSSFCSSCACWTPAPPPHALSPADAPSPARGDSGPPTTASTTSGDGDTGAAVSIFACLKLSISKLLHYRTDFKCYSITNLRITRLGHFLSVFHVICNWRNGLIILPFRLRRRYHTWSDMKINYHGSQ